ncbi:hypothetical protein CRG98_006546 [Punica granatum]|uniref:Uncharacterized protein n=1 Tax=Punica granatum TaxID=22663 RepID=A0A2I0KX41_PUNGR|nr:hypothetical protein CRG98_006546 [Punica granatum]
MAGEDYVKEFKLLTVECELRESQETTIARSLGGPNKEIADMIERQPFVSLKDVIKLAVKVKEQEVDPHPPVRCRDIKCLEFHGFRHFTSEFPNWREVTIQNPHTVESEVEKAVEDVCRVTSKEKVEYADEGEKLMAHQVVSSESKLVEPGVLGEHSEGTDFKLSKASCTNPNVDSRWGPHALFWIARLESIHLPVGTRERRSRHFSFYNP